MKMEQRECSETSEYKVQTPGNYLEENIQHINTYVLRFLFLNYHKVSFCFFVIQKWFKISDNFAFVKTV